MSPVPKSPLELPELLKRISRFVDLNDALVCARVCKTWSDHFASAVWHTIDFAVHKDLDKMDVKVLARYSHHIRVVENICERHQILVLIASKARKLKRLTIDMTATQDFYAYSADLLRRVNASLEHVEIVQYAEDTVPYFAVDSLFPATSTGATSKLSFIKIDGLMMTRDSLSSLLENCPSLDQLDIQDTTLLFLPTYDDSDIHFYKHSGVTHLTAPIGQIFGLGHTSENTPSLFIHFPNLKTWSTWSIGSDGPEQVSRKVIRDQVTKYCPVLTALWTSTRAPISIGMFTQVFEGLTEICIRNEEFSAELVVAILDHRETLNQVYTFTSDYFYDSEVIPETKSNQLGTGGWIIQSLPRHCTGLKVLQFPSFEMDMDDVDHTKWACQDLEELHIRIQGLDTKEKIDRAVKLWKEGRIAIQKQANSEQEGSDSSRLQLGSIIPPGDKSIEARVARHLLKFKKLREVWLGWKVRKVHTKV